MRKGKKFCDLCGSIIPRDPEMNDGTPLMLVVRDDIWSSISKSKKFICPDCMIKIWGRKFKYEELKSFSYGFIPCNLWYLRRNGLIPRAKEDIDYKKVMSFTKGRREFYFKYIKKLFS